MKFYSFEECDHAVDQSKCKNKYVVKALGGTSKTVEIIPSPRFCEVCRYNSEFIKDYINTSEGLPDFLSFEYTFEKCDFGDKKNKCRNFRILSVYSIVGKETAEIDTKICRICSGNSEFYKHLQKLKKKAEVEE